MVIPKFGFKKEREEPGGLILQFEKKKGVPMYFDFIAILCGNFQKIAFFYQKGRSEGGGGLTPPPLI